MAKVIEFHSTYKDVTSGFDEPSIMYVTGKTLRQMAKNLGGECGRDFEGNPILDDELYCVTERGVWPVS